MPRTVVLSSIAGGAVAAVLAVTAGLAGPSSAEPLAGQAFQACSTCQDETGQSQACAAGPRWGQQNQQNQQNQQGRRAVSARGQNRQGQAGQARTQQDQPTTSGTLSAAQLADLAWMAEEEKLAHDVYIALAETTGDARFSRIASSESRHLEAMRTLLARYDQTDPTAGRAAGEFANEEFATLYGDLVAKGSTSLDAALEVGRTIERMDIADLTDKRAGLSAPDVQRVYASLLAGSENHLRAFGG
jgi:hypothetical protein